MRERTRLEQLQDQAARQADAVFADPDFQDGLARLAASAQEASRRFAADAVTLAALAAQVPRCPGDESGAGPWTSFLLEVAVNQSCSDSYATHQVVLATTLVAHFPRTLALLASGAMPVYRARTLVERAWGQSEEVMAAVDAEVAERACELPPARIARLVDRVLARHDAEALAKRAKARAKDRDVSLRNEGDGQASVLVTGPALPVLRWFGSIDTRARELRAAGDPRTLGQLRCDLATGVEPMTGPEPTDAAGNTAADSTIPSPRPAEVDLTDRLTDRRCTRPVQVIVEVPLATALGQSDEPGHLQGYGPLPAPQCRELLLGAELRPASVDAETGRLLDLAERVVRPDPTPEGLRAALDAMARQPLARSSVSWREEAQHDPSAALARFVKLRDRYCDGPTGKAHTTNRAHLDHEVPYPHGPTSAANLVSRSPRMHGLKHYGWKPVRTPTATIWTSPAGQVVRVPRDDHPPPPLR